MAQGLMGLQDLLGQSSNAQQQSGLLGGGVFSQPESRGRRRSRLLNEAIAGAGQNPYARLGASFGGLIGMGGRAAGEGLGLLDKPAEVQQSDAIRQVQKEVADRGIDPMSNPREFGDFVSGRFQELGQPQLATRSLLQARQIESQFAPEAEPSRITVTGGTEQAEQLTSSLGYTVPEGRTFSLEITGNRITGEKDITSEEDEVKGSPANVRLADGSFVRGIERPDGTVVDLEGNEFPANANVVGLNLAASQESDLPQKDVDILNNKEIGVKNYIDLANEAIGVYNQNPTANSLAAEGTRILSGVKSEFDAILDVTGIELADNTSRSEILEVGNYDSAFEDLGLENAALKPLYLSLALSQAQAEAEQKGRALSDRDVDRFLRQQGSEYANPRYATELLRRNASRLRNAYINEFETRTGKDFDGQFDPIAEFNPQDPPQEGSQRSGAQTQDQTQPENGQQMNFSEMSSKELGNVNLDDLSDEQIDQYLKATEQLGE